MHSWGSQNEVLSCTSKGNSVLRKQGNVKGSNVIMALFGPNVIVTHFRFVITSLPKDLVILWQKKALGGKLKR